MRNAFALILMGLMIGGIPAFAMDGDDECRGDHCEPRKKKEDCFNLVCYYYKDDKDKHDGYETCKAAATFNKDVTLDGGEVEDDSNERNNPQLEVTCDNKMLFNNAARRFTNLLGTRIQGETGPHPAISLPRGALHTGTNGTSGNHVASSILEIDTGSDIWRAKGKCYIWTGAP